MVSISRCQVVLPYLKEVKTIVKNANMFNIYEKDQVYIILIKDIE